MYSEQSISLLINRIGWENSINRDFPIIISHDNLLSNSGRKIVSFHQLATVENLYSNISEKAIDETKFNQLLFNIKEQSVLEVVTTVLDQHHLYDESFNYSEVIASKCRLFDECIGLTIAVKCLELFISSTRINPTERSNAMSFNALKIELEGARNDNGHFIAKGIIYKKAQAVKLAQKIIFPEPILIIRGDNW